MPRIITILATSLKLSGRPEAGDGGDGGDIRATGNPMTRSDVLYMIKRRARDAALPYSTCCHSYRATGITAYLDNGGSLGNAQAMAAHESPRTTKLYDRTDDQITLDEVENLWRYRTTPPPASFAHGCDRLISPSVAVKTS
jgi:integrase